MKHTYIYSKLAKGSKFSSRTRGINKKPPPNVSDFRNFSSCATFSMLQNISDFKLLPPVSQYQQIVFSDEASFDWWGFKLFHRPHIKNFWENTETRWFCVGFLSVGIFDGMQSSFQYVTLNSVLPQSYFSEVRHWLVNLNKSLVYWNRMKCLGQFLAENTNKRWQTLMLFFSWTNLELIY